MSTEKNPKPTIDPGSNMEPLRKEISTAYDEIVEHKEARSSANADIAAILTGLEAKGISKRAMRMAMTYVEMDEDEQAGFDMAYGLARASLGAPLQGDMFDAPKE